MRMLWFFSLRRPGSWVIPRHGCSSESAAGGLAVFPRAGYSSIPCTPISPIGISTYHNHACISIRNICDRVQDALPVKAGSGHQVQASRSKCAQTDARALRPYSHRLRRFFDFDVDVAARPHGPRRGEYKRSTFRIPHDCVITTVIRSNDLATSYLSRTPAPADFEQSSPPTPDRSAPVLVHVCDTPG